MADTLSAFSMRPATGTRNSCVKIRLAGIRTSVPLQFVPIFRVSTLGPLQCTPYRPDFPKSELFEC